MLQHTRSRPIIALFSPISVNSVTPKTCCRNRWREMFSVGTHLSYIHTCPDKPELVKSHCLCPSAKALARTVSQKFLMLQAAPASSSIHLLLLQFSSLFFNTKAVMYSMRWDLWEVCFRSHEKQKTNFCRYYRHSNARYCQVQQWTTYKLQSKFCWQLILCLQSILNLVVSHIQPTFLKQLCYSAFNYEIFYKVIYFLPHTMLLPT